MQHAAAMNAAKRLLDVAQIAIWASVKNTSQNSNTRYVPKNKCNWHILKHAMSVALRSIPTSGLSRKPHITLITPHARDAIAISAMTCILGTKPRRLLLYAKAYVDTVTSILCAIVISAHHYRF